MQSECAYHNFFLCCIILDSFLEHATKIKFGFGFVFATGLTKHCFSQEVDTNSDFSTAELLVQLLARNATNQQPLTWLLMPGAGQSWVDLL